MYNYQNSAYSFSFIFVFLISSRPDANSFWRGNKYTVHKPLDHQSLLTDFCFHRHQQQHWLYIIVFGWVYWFLSSSTTYELAEIIRLQCYYEDISETRQMRLTSGSCSQTLVIKAADSFDLQDSTIKFSEEGASTSLTCDCYPNCIGKLWDLLACNLLYNQLPKTNTKIRKVDIKIGYLINNIFHIHICNLYYHRIYIINQTAFTDK